MTFAKTLFTVSISICILLGLVSHALSHGKAPAPQTITYGTDELANTKVPPPPMVKLSSEGISAHVQQTQQPRFNVKYNDFTEEAKEAFQYAVDIWASLIRSPVQIKIHAH